MMDTNHVTGTAKSIAGKAEGALGRMTGDAATEASGRVREAEGLAQKVYGQAVDAAGDLGETASGIAKQALDTGGEYYRDSSRALAATVKKQPLGALFIAGAIGFTLALMMKRQPRRHSHWNS